MPTKIIKCDLSYTHQSTDLGLEIRSQDELISLIEALMNQENSVIALHNQHYDITLSVYVRFRERIKEEMAE